jgi:TolB protein
MKTIVLLGALLLALVTAAAGAATGVRTTDRDPVFAPDGRTLAFVRTSTSGSIMLVDRSGKHLRTLVPHVDASGLAWSPDGRSIAYSVAFSDIWRVDVATGATQQLTHDGPFTDWQPSWSPDGTTIAYDRFERCFRCTGVWLMNADGSDQREVAANDARRPTFSPVADQLALSLAPVRAVDTAGETVLPGSGAYTTWSPHGTYVAYTNNGLWIESLATKRPRRISKLINERPSWSPDGNVIAGGYRTRVALVHAKDGSGFKLLPASTVEAGTPTWSGGLVAFVHSGWCGIDVAREDGTHVRRLTRAC